MSKFILKAIKIGFSIQNSYLNLCVRLVNSQCLCEKDFYIKQFILYYVHA